MPNHTSQRQSSRFPLARVPLPVWILLLGASALWIVPGTKISNAEIKSFAARHERQAEYLCAIGDLDSCRQQSAAVQPR